MKTITIYELLGLVKDGKAPEKIIAGDSETEYYLDKNLKDYINTRNQEKLFEDEIGKFLKYYINDEVEIIEEDKNIEQLVLNNCDVWTGKTDTDLIVDKINEIIDCLNSKGE